MIREGERLIASVFPLKETIYVDVYRARPDGYAARPDETLPVQDLIVTNGLNYIAARIAHGDTVASAMNYMAVGTATIASTYTSAICSGEVARKALAVGSANANVWSAVATFGGFSESLTSLAITEAGIFNHASSGQGTMMQRVTFAAVTLAQSDLLSLTLQTNVGSR